MSNPITFVSATVHKILDLVGEKKMSVEVAIELLDVMQANGFVDKHAKFFDAVKLLAQKVSSNEESNDA